MYKLNFVFRYGKSLRSVKTQPVTSLRLKSAQHSDSEFPARPDPEVIYAYIIFVYFDFFLPSFFTKLTGYA